MEKGKDITAATRHFIRDLTEFNVNFAPSGQRRDGWDLATPGASCRSLQKGMVDSQHALLTEKRLAMAFQESRCSLYSHYFEQDFKARRDFEK